jgi:hypothetical protein
MIENIYVVIEYSFDYTKTVGYFADKEKANTFAKYIEAVYPDTECVVAEYAINDCDYTDALEAVIKE